MAGPTDTPTPMRHSHREPASEITNSVELYSIDLPRSVWPADFSRSQTEQGVERAPTDQARDEGNEAKDLEYCGDEPVPEDEPPQIDHDQTQHDP